MLQDGAVTGGIWAQLAVRGRILTNLAHPFCRALVHSRSRTVPQGYIPCQKRSIPQSLEITLTRAPLYYVSGEKKPPPTTTIARDRSIVSTQVPFAGDVFIVPPKAPINLLSGETDAASSGADPVSEATGGGAEGVRPFLLFPPSWAFLIGLASLALPAAFVRFVLDEGGEVGGVKDGHGRR